jgi:2-methylaconitate cis-trans-isomerase PrpF
MHLIEKIRYEASQLSPTLQSVFSSAAPKVCIVGPTTTYTTTGGTQVKESEIDLVIRSISVGNVHRTIPATTLAALAVAAAYPQSIVAETISSLTSRTDHDSVTVRAGHPAGTAEATAKMVEQQPKSIAYIRTARRLFQGDVLVPPSIFASE